MEGRNEEGKKLRPEGIITSRTNFDHWNEAFPEDDVKPVLAESVFSNAFETIALMGKPFAEYADANKRLRIVLDYDPQAKKMVVTYFLPKERQSTQEEG